MAMTTPDSKPQKRNTRPGSPAPLTDARREREHEKIGGGHFVFRRTGGTGRIRAPEWPFEHPTIEAARSERDRLSEKYPDEKFVVVSEERNS